MNFFDIIITLFEILLVGVTLWCLFNEDKLISFEEGIKVRFRRRRLKVVRANSSIRLAQNK